MKKLRYVVMSILLVCLSALLLLCACGPDGQSSSSSAGGYLVMNTKYVRGAFGEDREDYFIFRSDGTGDYSRYYVPTTPYVEHYTMHFKWFYADGEGSAVVCFYDGVEYGKDHKASSLSDSTNYLLTVSEYVLCSNNGISTNYYINEDYVGALENYRKE